MTKHERCDLLNNNKDFIKAVFELVEEQQSEIKTLGKITLEDYVTEYKNKIRSEAVKEFAERLKEKSFKTIRNYGLTKDVVEVCDIDNLVKEMVGENKNV